MMLAASDPFGTTIDPSALAAKERVGSELGELSGLAAIVKGDRSSDFRMVTWGMPMAAVKQGETAKLLNSTKSSCVYRWSEHGCDCRLAYAFDSTGLTKAQLAIKQACLEPAKQYDEYESLITQITKRLGMPVERENAWNDSTAQSDRSSWGSAVCSGSLSCRLKWKSERTLADCNLTGKNQRFDIMIVFKKFEQPSHRLQ